MLKAKWNRETRRLGTRTLVYVSTKEIHHHDGKSRGPTITKTVLSIALEDVTGIVEMSLVDWEALPRPRGLGCPSSGTDCSACDGAGCNNCQGGSDA